MVIMVLWFLFQGVISLSDLLAWFYGFIAWPCGIRTKSGSASSSPPLTTAARRIGDRRLARPPGDLAEWAACRGVLINHRQ
ncbi:hypothetical protein DMH17_08730 [Raoultella planticola]|nr:hypothetical protein [Raoultella planticola]